VTITRRRRRAATATRLPALIGVAALVVALVAACGETPTPSPVTAGSPSAAPSASVASSAPSTPAPSAGASGAASPTPSAGPDGSASPQGNETPLPTVSPLPLPGSADACSGTAENRDFYAALAASVAWDVYCPVLPPGWFVDSGSYRLSNGGQLSITYRGPDGARIVVREGNYCAGLPDCIPTGPDAGTASFGDRDARLLDLGNGSWLVVVAPAGEAVGWQATGSGMDGSALVGYTAVFARVDQ